MAPGRPSHLTTLSRNCLFTWRICRHVLRIAQAFSSLCAAVSGDRVCWAWWPRHRIHKARSHTCKHKGSADVMLLVKAYPDQEYAQHLEEQLYFRKLLRLMSLLMRKTAHFFNPCNQLRLYLDFRLNTAGSRDPSRRGRLQTSFCVTGQ